MTSRIVPMLHVPDVKATAEWYQSLGFALRATHEAPGCPMDWACLSFGASDIMFTTGGRRASTPRRDVDLYIHTDDLEACFQSLAPKAKLVEGLHETEYGMREFIIKDLNGFWLTFGQPLTKG